MNERNKPTEARRHGEQASEQTEVLIRREGKRVVLEGARRTFSRRFRSLAGSATDFPYPPEPR